jgi:hypothetical protein
MSHDSTSINFLHDYLFAQFYNPAFKSDKNQAREMLAELPATTILDLAGSNRRICCFPQTTSNLPYPTKKPAW